MTWEFLAQGSFNKVYRNGTSTSNATEVLKVQKSDLEGPDAVMDAPERSVRLWNEINAGFMTPARVVSDQQLGHGWVCPFVRGRQATDNEMCPALMDIYSRTGRIVVDAISPKNFVTTPQGQVVCIDIGMALRLQKQHEVHVPGVGMPRVDSDTSLDTWSGEGGFDRSYIPYLKKCDKSNPKTAATVRALLFMQQYRPDILDVSFLKNNDRLLFALSKAYDHAQLLQLQQEWNSISPTMRENFARLNAMRESGAAGMRAYFRSFPEDKRKQLESMLGLHEAMKLLWDRNRPSSIIETVMAEIERVRPDLPVVIPVPDSPESAASSRSSSAASSSAPMVAASVSIKSEEQQAAARVEQQASDQQAAEEHADTKASKRP